MNSWDELLKTFQYKPNFKFFYEYDINYGWHRINIRVETPNTYNTDETIFVQFVRLVPDFRDINEEYARELLRRLIHDAECHEADEWMRFDGVMVFNPHKEE